MSLRLLAPARLLGRCPTARHLVVPALLVALISSLAFGVGSASAYRYFQSEISETPANAPMPGAFGHAYKVAVDGSGDVWVLDANGPYGGPYSNSGKGVVDEFDPSGSFLSQGTGEGGWSPEGSGLEGLAFDNATSLAYVADRNNTDLWKLNSNAVVQGSIAGSTSSWAPGTYQCCSIQVDADNTGDAVGGDLLYSRPKPAVRTNMRVSTGSRQTEHLCHLRLKSHTLKEIISMAPPASGTASSKTRSRLPSPLTVIFGSQLTQRSTASIRPGNCWEGSPNSLPKNR